MHGGPFEHGEVNHIGLGLTARDGFDETCLVKRIDAPPSGLTCAR